MARTVNIKKDARSKVESGTRWWLAQGPEKTAAAVFGWMDRLRTRSRAENFRDLLFEAIYTGRPLGQDMDFAQANIRQTKGAPARLNVTESVVDTVVAKLGRRRPMPIVSADDAGWTEKLFAKRVSRVLRRKMGGADLERMFPEALRDSTIRGTCAVKVYAENGDVQCERIPRYECIVDPREARYGKPRTLVHVKSVAADVLTAKFPKYAEQIARASREHADDWQPFDYDSPAEPDMIRVVEAWRLGPNGRHVIAIQGTTLFDEKWERPRFPIVFGRWKKMPRGMWGKGVVEILAGMQAFIDGEFKDIQEAFYWASALITFVPKGSNIIKHHLRSRHPAIVETEGAVPQYVAPNPVSVQRLDFFWSLVSRMYEIAGVSQLSASSKNPLGAGASGKAIDTMYDIESDRFSDEELEYAWMRVEVGRCIIDEARALVEAHAADKKADRDDDKLAAWIEEIGNASKWRKFDIDEGPYHLIMEPVNFVPESRGGRLATANELGKAGLVTDPKRILSLFEEPDMQRLYRNELAPYNAQCAVLEDVGDPEKPLPYVDPQFAPYDSLIQETKNEYLDAKSRDAPEDVLQRYRDFLQLVIAEQQAAQPQANMAPPPGASIPGMSPGPGAPPQMAPGLMGGAPGLAGGPQALPQIMPQGIA